MDRIVVKDFYLRYAVIMKWVVVLLFSFFIVFNLSTTATAAQAQGYRENQLIVKYTPVADSVVTEIFRHPPEANPIKRFGQGISDFFSGLFSFFSPALSEKRAIKKQFSELIVDFGINHQEALFSAEQSADNPGEHRTIQLSQFDVKEHQNPISRVYIVTISNKTVEEVVTAFKASGLVEYAQPNFLYHFLKTPNDEMFPQQTSYKQINSEKAWDKRTDSSVVIAVVDSGINYNHPDLKDNIWTGTFTVDGKTYSDVHGYDFVQNDTDPMDEYGHGTTVAGVIGAVGNNGIGGTGLAWKATIMAVRVGDNEESASPDSITLSKGVVFAANNNVSVISLSIGLQNPLCSDEKTEGGIPDLLFGTSITYAIKQKDVFVASAAGNDAINAVCDMPGANPDILVVSGSNEDGKPAQTSNYGPFTWKESKIIMAPKFAVTTDLNGSYTTVSGTSFSSPLVAATAALIRSEQQISALSLRQHLINSADDTGADFTSITGADNGAKMTYGKRLNVAQALENIPSDSPGDNSSNFQNPPQSVSPPPTDPVPALSGKTFQADWVYNGIGRCWSAWSDASCTLLPHEGGTITGQQDITGDGQPDIVCSEGSGIRHATTITNIASVPIVVACERYACVACQSAENGNYAQCDGGVDPSATRISETVTLTPGCVATCTLSGAYGACLSQTNPSPVLQTPVTPTQTVGQPFPTSITGKPTPTSAQNQPIPTNPPINNAALPLMIAAENYNTEYSSQAPTYIYGWLTEGALSGSTGSAKDQKILQQITVVKNVSGNTIKMMMVSSYATLEYLLTKYKTEMKSAGITIIGYNTEGPPVSTPQDELNRLSDSTTNNSVAKLTRLAKQHDFDVIWGPIRNVSVQVSKNPAAIKQMTDAGLLGVAFQEQQFIERETAVSREQAVKTDAAVYRAIGGPNFQIHVQIMSSRCGTKPWSKCKDFVNRIKGTIDSLAIWASGPERTALPEFAKEMRGY